MTDQETSRLAEYDVLVIGAGPGGSSAAYFLAASGAKVLLMEKKKFPRAKTCGDGLTPRAVKVLHELGVAGTVGQYKKVRGLRVFGAKRKLEMQFPALSDFPSYGLICRRKQFDNDLAENARSAGAELMMGTEATAPIVEDGVVRGVRWVRKTPAESGGVEESEGGEARAHFTIVADGASSPFGKKMGLSRVESFPVGLAIRTYYKAERDDDEYMESWLELKKEDEFLPGYGWIFPLGDGTVNVGVGLLTTFGQWRKVNLNKLQRAYVEMLPKSYGITHETQLEPFQSGRLPMGASLAKPYGAGYLAIGDAAGLVNPFNGEGIAYALETGKMAAVAVTAALRNGRTLSLHDYAIQLQDVYGAYYRMGRKFTKIIGHPRAFRALCQVGLRSQPLMEFVFQVMANLTEERGGRTTDRVFRAMVELAERDIPTLKAPEIPAPEGFAADRGAA